MTDAYISYIQKFFKRWVPLYDYFARSVYFAYSAAVKVLKPFPGMKLLDVCTGTGEIAIRCARAGAEVVGVDITEAMLERARRKTRDLSIKFLHMDARRMEFDDKSFDAAVLSFCLHDMPRKVRLEVLNEAVRVSKNRVVVLDYDLPSQKFLKRVLLRLISTFESPYFPSFVKEGAPALFAELGLNARLEKRVFSGLFSVFVVEISGSKDNSR